MWPSRTGRGHKMKSSLAEILRAGLAGAALAAALAVAPVHAASDRPLFMSVGTAAGAPVGWREFCAQYAPECETPAMTGRDAVLTTQAWNELLRINQWVNDTIKPMTDLEHWGVAERWNYPDDGYGDCEDYVLLKRRMLMQAGWPRQRCSSPSCVTSRGMGMPSSPSRPTRASSSSTIRTRTCCSGRRPVTAS